MTEWETLLHKTCIEKRKMDEKKNHDDAEEEKEAAEEEEGRDSMQRSRVQKSPSS
jgi:hypothetical protein